ncbi:MAG: efflux RND transporter permease subunit, partial [Negativicutes bacterium]|nr:efflux RND transporter permease subunit [Negativicutes bacterium]
RLGDVATIRDGAGEPSDYVLFGSGAGRAARGIDGSGGSVPAVTISVAKKPKTNATALNQRLLTAVGDSRAGLLPRDVQVTVSRNYGETANDKSNELLEHMLIATLSVVGLVALALGRREAVVVAVAVPVTLALTLAATYLLGYTLNRVTLFALIFSIGILVDDAIVVVENIHRHFRLNGAGGQNAVRAVDEVGNPTILATFTVIAALLPMAFVSGLMGPYMRPIPVGASAAMLFSLLVAFIASPWLAIRLLAKAGPGRGQGEPPSGQPPEPGWAILYQRLIAGLLANRRRRRQVLAAVAGLLLAVCAMVPLKLIMVKMLPFDNKSEFQVIIDMPTGTGLETTAALAGELAGYLARVPEVSDYQIYVGSSAPYNFNGLVRHYFLRDRPWQADIQVNLVPRGERSRSSHEIATAVREPLQQIAGPYQGRVKIAEVPPGPPVLSTLVAEIYGPDQERRRQLAARVRDIFSTTGGVVDVDWYVEDERPQLLLAVDQLKAAQNGVTVAAVARAVDMALTGERVGLVHLDHEREPVYINLRLPYRERSRFVAGLQQMTLSGEEGQRVPLAELVRVSEGSEARTIYHKNLRPVTYVTGDMAGRAESPVYGILAMRPAVAGIKTPSGQELAQYFAVQPPSDSQYAMKWDGEWHVTYEVFRDMGISFAVVLVLIYLLVLAWFGDFVTPLLIMVPIPLTLIGILPGHWLFGAFFTATSMIGFIALSGIIVRNSILLVDFAESERQAGSSYDQALIRAGAVRMRPILLTAAAVVVGSLVMLFDPIFQGLAIAMMFGAVVATLLTLLVIPLLCWEFGQGRNFSQRGETDHRRRPEPA